MRRAEAMENDVYNVVQSAVAMAPTQITMACVDIIKTSTESVSLQEREAVGIVEPKRLPVGILKARARQAVAALEDG